MSTNPYVVGQVTVAPRLLAGVRAHVPLGQVAQHFGTHLDHVYAAARTGAVTLDGQNVFIYRSAVDGILTVDFCVGVTKPFEAIRNVMPIETPNGIAATTAHWGEYSGIRNANRAILEWCDAHSRLRAGPSWEVYGHWSDNPSERRTDIYYLLTPTT